MYSKKFLKIFIILTFFSIVSLFIYYKFLKNSKTNLNQKETSEEGLSVNFAELTESLDKIAEGITNLNSNISELLKVEKKEGKETKTYFHDCSVNECAFKIS